MNRFWTKVDIKGRDECWNWQAGKGTAFKYGMFWFQEKMQFAHRVSFFLKFGYWPDGVGRHTCDNAGCVNPYHIIPGTQADNIRDCVIKKRNAFGEKNGQAKLTAAEVKEIKKRRLNGERGSDLAHEFGVSQQSVCDIVHGRTWTKS